MTLCAAALLLLAVAVFCACAVLWRIADTLSHMHDRMMIAMRGSKPMPDRNP